MNLSRVISPAAKAAAVAGAVIYLIAPKRPERAAAAPFYGRSFAHRGLYSKDQSVPENSLPAFTAAAAAGYGAELDVRLTSDGVPVVFHDDTLERMCSAPGSVESVTYAELQELRLSGTEYGIPTLDEVLEAMGGAPVIVEIKARRRYGVVCAAVLKAISGYPGSACVESFDPRIVGWFRRKAPHVLRGQLSNRIGGLRSAGFVGGFLLSRLLTNVVARPHFIAWSIGKKPLTVRICERLGAMRVSWTSRSHGDAPKADAVIFEHYRPAVRFK